MQLSGNERSGFLPKAEGKNFLAVATDLELKVSRNQDNVLFTAKPFVSFFFSSLKKKKIHDMMFRSLCGLFQAQSLLRWLYLC